MTGSLIDALQGLIDTNKMRVEIRRGPGESVGGARLYFVHNGSDHTLSACVEVPAETFSLTSDFEVRDLTDPDDPACPETHLVAVIADWFFAGSAPQVAGCATPYYRALRREAVLAFFRVYDLHPNAPVKYSLTLGLVTMNIPLDGTVSLSVPWEKIMRDHPLGLPMPNATSIASAIGYLQGIADSPAYGLRGFRRRPRIAT